MIQKKELLILFHLRQNARKNLTKISKETGIPISTIFDRIRRFESSIIKKHTALLDFSKLGYEVKLNLTIKVPKERREELKEHLIKDHRVNTIYRINNGYDFMVECIFRNIKDAHDFVEGLEKFNVKSPEEYYILEEIKKEGFMADPQLIDLFAN